MKSIPINTILQTERLQLRDISLSDINLVWSASRTPGFNDGMVWEPPENKEELIPIAEKKPLCLGRRKIVHIHHRISRNKYPGWKNRH
jgi:hypothetical protein